MSSVTSLVPSVLRGLFTRQMKSWIFLLSPLELPLQVGHTGVGDDDILGGVSVLM